MAELAPAQTVSVRTAPTLQLTIQRDGRLERPRMNDGELTFVHARRVTARVTGRRRPWRCSSG
jgi:hypothetical protein